jgi:apolipoprotein N-acyltransferase
VAAIFLTTFIIGGLAVLSTVVLSQFIDRDGPPFGVTSKAVGLMGAGLGGLISTWAGLDSLWSGIVAIASFAALMAALYAVLLPYLRRRRERRDRACYIGLGRMVTRVVPVGDFGGVVRRQRRQPGAPARQEQ